MDKNELNSKEDIKLHDILIKQHSLLLQQYETMSSMQQRNDEKADEIDLSRLIPRFLKKRNVEEDAKHAAVTAKKIQTGFFSAITKIFKTIIEYYTSGIKRFSIIVGIIFILSAAYGVYIYSTSDKIYSSTMIIDSGVLESVFFSGLTENLGKLARSEGTELAYSSELARKLKLNEEQAAVITNFEFAIYEEYFIEEQRLTDSTEQIIDYPFFTVTVSVLDNSVLEILNTNLFTYFRDNPYVNENREIKREVLQESIENLKGQLSSIDSLKQAIVSRVEKKNSNNQYFIKETSNAGGGLILSQEEPLDMSPMVPFEKALSVQKEQLANKESLLRLDSDFKIIDDFSAVSIPVFPRLTNIIIYSFNGFILGSIIAFFLVFIFPKKKKS